MIMMVFRVGDALTDVDANHKLETRINRHAGGRGLKADERKTRLPLITATKISPSVQ